MKIVWNKETQTSRVRKLDVYSYCIKDKFETSQRYTGTWLYKCDGNALKIQIVKQIKR